MQAPRIFTPEYYARMRALESTSWWNAGMRDVAARLLSRCPIPARGLLLDVGCGSGQTMDWFTQQYPEWDALGFDVAAEGLKPARALGTRVMRASALQIPVRAESIDLALTLDVVQHLPLNGGDVTAMREIARVLKPGGHLLLRTNAQAFPHTPDDPEFDFHKYEVPELRERLTASGFEILRISRVNAVLGLAEIPRELRARGRPNSYHGILATPRQEPSWHRSLKRNWLGFEGALVAGGLSLPFGRTIVALCQKAGQ